MQYLNSSRVVHPGLLNHMLCLQACNASKAYRASCYCYNRTRLLQIIFRVTLIKQLYDSILGDLVDTLSGIEYEVFPELGTFSLMSCERKYLLKGMKGR